MVAVLASLLASVPCQVARGAAPRGRGAPTSAPRRPSVAPPAPSSDVGRPHLVGVALACLARLAPGTPRVRPETVIGWHPARLSPVLDLEEPTPHWTSRRPPVASWPHRKSATSSPPRAASPRSTSSLRPTSAPLGRPTARFAHHQTPQTNAPSSRLRSELTSLKRRAGCVTLVLGFHNLGLVAPPGFEPGMEILQIWRGRKSCGLGLVAGRSSTIVFASVWAVLDYIWTAGCPPVEATRRREPREAACTVSGRDRTRDSGS